MKRILILPIAWISGYTFNAVQPYIKALQKQQIEDDHTFLEQISQHSQPKIIDYLHSSPDKHFLHNLIVQNEKAFNFFKVYVPNNAQEDPHLHIVFNAADDVQDLNNDVHCGLLATIIDNAFGQLSFVASGYIPSATANLKIDYKQPIKPNQDYLITCEVDHLEGRKIFLKATVQDQNNIICTEASALFITVNWGGKAWKQTIDILSHTKIVTDSLSKFLM